jgi:predicted nuclease with RNAse H fold/dephospho-CoA kinase
LDALKLLMNYNHCDIEGMRFIFDKAIERLLRQQKVPRRIRENVPRFFVPSKLTLVNGKQVLRNKANHIKVVPLRKPAAAAQISLADLSPKDTADALRVVGIDLTGSANRPSGWCLSEGFKAVTCSVNDDETVIATTLAARPHLVSIDSPLSLPKGRISVSDDDPGRKEFGIMRHCERMLKKRGINVYPALIPSMQKLTARGIRLAARLRKLGVPVIESYPGAAQDIMGIPRKRASLDMLRDGLAEFGIRGPYLETQVSHDELDAITAAVVGIFFWSGKFESLGTEDEEALIIPDLKTDTTSWQKRQVIGISGAIAAGKTTSARYLESQGFRYTRYSMVLDRLMREQGKQVSRTALQKYGDKVHRKQGQRWLGRKLLGDLPSTEKIVIDGLRFPDDHAFLVEAFGPAFCHVHVEAEENFRRARFDYRESDGVSFDEATAHPVEQRASLLRPLAHVVLPNESTLRHLHSRLHQLISKSAPRLECQ